MKQFIKDLEIFVLKYWKPILGILLVAYLITNYPDIKSGITDGWSNK